VRKEADAYAHSFSFMFMFKYKFEVFLHRNYEIGWCHNIYDYAVDSDSFTATWQLYKCTKQWEKSGLKWCELQEIRWTDGLRPDPDAPPRRERTGRKIVQCLCLPMWISGPATQQCSPGAQNVASRRLATKF